MPIGGRSVRNSGSCDGERGGAIDGRKKEPVPRTGVLGGCPVVDMSEAACAEMWLLLMIKPVLGLNAME